MSKKIIVSFHYVSKERPDPRMAMMDDSEGSGTQTFIAEVGKPLQFANPSEYAELSFVIDEVVGDEGEAMSDLDDRLRESIKQVPNEDGYCEGEDLDKAVGEIKQLVASEIFNLAHKYANNDKTMIGSEELRNYHYFNAINKVGGFEGR